MKSMTAFARLETPLTLGLLSWEIRAVNQRYLEASFKIFEPLRHLEMPLRELLKNAVNRGKVEVTLKFYANQTTETTLDLATAAALNKTLQQLQNSFANLAPIDPLTLLNLPGLVKNSAETTDLRAVETDIINSFEQLLATFNHARSQEGAALKTLMHNKAEAIVLEIHRVSQRQPERLKLHHQKMQQRLADLLGNTEFDAQRLAQELALLTQRLDIAEELDRLNTHVSALQETFESTEPVGRRLDFLLQEMNREANTLGSKSQDSTTTQASIELKVLIEQIREQIQNIE